MRRVCATPTYSVHLVAVYVYKWFYVANTVDGNWLDLWVNVLVNSIVIVPFMVNAFIKQDHYALDSIVDLPRQYRRYHGATVGIGLVNWDVISQLSVNKSFV